MLAPLSQAEKGHWVISGSLHMCSKISPITEAAYEAMGPRTLKLMGTLLPGHPSHLISIHPNHWARLSPSPLSAWEQTLNIQKTLRLFPQDPPSSRYLVWVSWMVLMELSRVKDRQKWPKDTDLNLHTLLQNLHSLHFSHVPRNTPRDDFQEVGRP